MKIKLISIACISLAFIATIHASDDQITTLRLYNATNQTINASLRWRELDPYKDLGWSAGENIEPEGTATFNRPSIILEIAPTRVAAYFDITVHGKTTSYCLLHHDAQDSKLKQNDLLQFNGSAILKGNDSVTHSWQYCD